MVAENVGVARSSETGSEATDPVCDLSVVLPCLNEAETLATCVKKAQRSMRDLGVDGEVIVADNGSTDGSQDVARGLGARVIDVVPVTLSPDGRTRSPHLRPWRDGWRHLRFLLLYSPRWLFFYPGIALMLVGAVLGIALLPGPLHVGSVGLDVNALVYCAVAVIIGFQAVTFSVFARAFAASEGLLPPNRSM